MNKKLLLVSLLTIIISISSVAYGYVIMVKGNPKDFTDIENHWAIESLNYCIEKGYIKGMTKTTFEPDTNMVRAEVVTTLWRLTGEDLTTINTNGKKVPKYVNMFFDIPDDSEYANTVAWANKNDIINGYSKRQFGPNDDVSREQLATILYRYIKNYKNVRLLDNLKVKEAVAYKDAGEISAWAKETVDFITQTGLMQGRTDGTFDPKAPVTRAEISAIVERLVKMV